MSNVLGIDPRQFLRKPEATPAKVAKVAKVGGGERRTLAGLATLADPGLANRAKAEPGRGVGSDGYEERAAIVEHDGGAPREWAEGFARLDCSAPPPGYSVRQWEQLIDDGGRFLDRWAAEAIRLGWSAEDAFGVHPVAPGARVDAMGLVPLISGGEVVSITADRASIRMPGGSVLTYLRRPRPGAVVVWEMLRGGQRWAGVD